MLSVRHRRRGDMVIELTSPQGTTSQLLAKRPLDDSTRGLDKWPFTSVEFWGENPQGNWTVKIRDAKVKKFVGICFREKRKAYSLCGQVVLEEVVIFFACEGYK